MLELILDKEFANNFHLAYKGDEEYVDDFRSYFIKKMQKIKLVSNYLNIEELEKQAKVNPFLELIIECIPELDFRTDLLKEINSPEFPITGSPFKLILTGENTETCNDRRNRFGLEYLNPSNLSERWHLYYSRRTDINRKTTDDPEIPADFKFDSWVKCKAFTHPINSIIIIDKYFLKWKNEKKLEQNIKNNFLPLFQNLLAEAATETPIEIMIVSEFEDLPEPKQAVMVQRSQLILEKLINHITHKAIMVNILVYKKSLFSDNNKAFHDRIIITNYFYIESGAGFIIFEDKGFRKAIETNTEIKFRSILNIQNYFSAFFDLKQLRLYCKKLENSAGRPDYLYFCPAKTNRLLKIEHP